MESNARSRPANPYCIHVDNVSVGKKGRFLFPHGGVRTENVHSVFSNNEKNAISILRIMREKTGNKHGPIQNCVETILGITCPVLGTSSQT